jgi:hypothetical protein
MPTAGARWIATRQPIVLDLWPVTPGDRCAPFTTVMNWSPLGDRCHEGRTYGQKEREFEPFFSLPREIGVAMEVAVKVPKEVRRRLVAGGWRIVDPVAITRDPRRYQEYLRASKAEFSVAKHGYVTTRCGWFSDRSAGYLASGRPVVVQDTGFSDWLETGAGVLAFKTPDEAKAGIDEIDRRYDYHRRAAREIIKEYFDAPKVLTRMIERVMHPATARSNGPAAAAPGTL